MPATAGRVRMPANNRVHSSAALQTHGIWQSAIGYDPYAPTNKEDKSSKPSSDGVPAASAGDSSENAYASFQGLLALARITGSSSNETRGACKKCGRVGHLTFQCRNFLSTKDPDDAAGVDKDAQANAVAVFEKIKKSAKNGEVSADESEEEEEEDSESSDSDVDPEIEKLIAARFGNKSMSKKSKTGMREMEDKRSRRGRSKKRSGKKRSSHSDESDTEEEDAKRKEKRRRKHRSSNDEDERVNKHRKSRKDKKRRSHKRKDSSDSDSYSESESDSDRRSSRKRAHRRRDDSGSSGESMDDRKGSHRRHENHRKRRAVSDSDSDSNGIDYETLRGRNGKKRSEKKSRSSRKEEKN